MKKIIFTICTLCMLCIFCTSSAQVNYIIKGKANNMDKKVAYLYSLESMAMIDSTIVNHDSFTFKGTYPKICFVKVILNRMQIPFILENGIINVSFNNPKNDYYPGKATGTLTNDIFCAYEEKTSAIQLERDALYMQISKLKEDKKDEKAVLQKKLKKLKDKDETFRRECLNQNLNNIIGAYILNYFIVNTDMSDEEIAKILADASPVVKENDLTKSAIKNREALTRTNIGQKFTDFKLKDPNDKEVSLSDYIGKGKYVLIDFWASWCGPCRKEMPNVKAAYEKYSPKGFEVVGISLDHKKEDWLKAIKDLGITWPQMSDLKGWRCEGAELYNIHCVPSTILIDPNGVIIAKNLRGEEIEKKLGELLK